jgi:hypothetical protein
MHEPTNLFTWATSELSQDAFLCWILSWADKGAANQNTHMHQGGVSFLNALLSLHGENLPEHAKVRVRKQVRNIDVVVEINDDRILLIEDKTDTSEHGTQLTRYVNSAQDEYPGRRILPLFIKTGDQNNYFSSMKAGYKIFLRRDFIRELRILEKQCLENAILSDFLSSMESRERMTESYKQSRIENWNIHAWKGFFMALQDHFDDLGWDYVSNPAGGFMGAWWHFRDWAGWKTYLQIEEQTLCVKMANWKEKPDSSTRAQMRDKWFHALKGAGEESSLPIVKPARHGNGATMTAAHIGPARQWIRADHEGNVDLPSTIQFLREAMLVVDKARQDH